jgi:hypothetical protein
MPPILTRQDVARAALARRIDPAALQAVIDVETGGSGFLASGRVKILFEGHWLWRRLVSRGIDPKRFALARPSLCFPSWTRAHYRGGAGEWSRVEEVIAWAQLHDTQVWESYKKAAYESCSWGLPQLMGFHYERVGFPNVYDLKHFMERGEPAQLEVMLRFLDVSGLIPRLQAHDWFNFARIYNGPGQVPFYAGKLAAAFKSAKGG